MVTIKINEIDYKFPTDYNDMSVQEYMLILSHYKLGQIDEIVFQWIPREIIDHMEPEGVETLVELVKILFASTAYLDFDDMIIAHEYYPSLMNLEYGQFLDWRKRISDDLDNSMLYTISLLHNQSEYSYSARLKEINIQHSAALGIFLQKKYTEELDQLAQKYRPLFEEQELDEDQLNAGFQNMKSFGPYATVFGLAKGDILNIAPVLKKSVGEVFTFLLYQ